MQNLSLICFQSVNYLEVKSSQLSQMMIKACEAQGLATALLQLPILMYLNYCKWLADHSFVIGEKHKLISSVANKIKI